jgi:isocitrate lyase
MEGKQLIFKEEMVKKIEAFQYAKRSEDLVLIARTDAIAVNSFEDAIERARAYLAPRILGSRTSRNESPRRLNAKTEALMATPGKMANQGALSAYSSAPPWSMSPQAGVGSCTPRPRKESEASIRMAWPRNAVNIIR